MTVCYRFCRPSSPYASAISIKVSRYWPSRQSYWRTRRWRGARCDWQSSSTTRIRLPPWRCDWLSSTQMMALPPPLRRGGCREQGVLWMPCTTPSWPLSTGIQSTSRPTSAPMRRWMRAVRWRLLRRSALSLHSGPKMTRQPSLPACWRDLRVISNRRNLLLRLCLSAHQRIFALSCSGPSSCWTKATTILLICSRPRCRAIPTIKNCACSTPDCSVQRGTTRAPERSSFYCSNATRKMPSCSPLRRCSTLNSNTSTSR